MTQHFSKEFKELVSGAREIAISLGYDHITTVHFFLADCSFNGKDSMRPFAFPNDEGYKQFKKEYAIEEGLHLDMAHLSLPLTIEAEETIKLAQAEMKLRGQKMVYSCHFFLAALKNADSILYSCFLDDIRALEKLEAYYTGLGSFEQGNVAEETPPQKENTSTGIFKRLFGRKK